MSELRELPVIPLRNTSLFPEMTTMIRIGRPGTVAAINAVIEQEEKLVFALAQREDSDEVSEGNLYKIGTIARVLKVQNTPAGLQVLVSAESRGIAARFEARDGYLAAQVRPAPDAEPPDSQDPAFIALHKELRERALEIGQVAGLPEEVLAAILENVRGPGALADLVAGHLDLEPAERQDLLETTSLEERLRRVLLHTRRHIEVLEAQKQIQKQIKDQIDERQKELVLREQMKAIRKELGDDDEAGELDALVERLEALELPPEARKEVERGLRRLRRVSGEAMEGQIIRAHLETIAELPWGELSEEHLDLEAAAGVLEEDHHGLDEVKDRVLEFLAVRQLHAARKSAEADRDEKEAERVEAAPEHELEARGDGPILLFVGPPGVGKTSIARSIARALGRKYVRVALGGARDEADIRGHRRTYVGALPGRIIQGLQQAGTRNPVFLLDEVDKLGAGYQGDPAAALLEVLDPAQNHAFTDHYLGVPFDLSEVLFVATANFIDRIPRPLLDRMEVVEFRGYTEAEKGDIARRFLLPRQLKAKALSGEQLVIDDSAIAELVTYYTREAGVRQLERVLGKLARKVAREVAGGVAAPITVTKGDLNGYLGRPKVHPERASLEDQVGVATGMYYTPVGGDIMFVEATSMKGEGRLTLTGQLGDVMKESAQAAWSYVRSQAGRGLALDPDGLQRDLHIHVPAGAVPKDGPSAGVTMAVALISSLTGRAADRGYAMTGEITLTGRVLPVGGIKEKLLGALRAGLTKIILPQDNAADLEDLPAEARAAIEVTLVRRIDEALEATLGREVFRDDAALTPRSLP